MKAGNTIELDGYCITAYKVNHTVPAVGYLVENTRGRRIFYTGDTGPTGDTWKRIGDRQINCLIIDVSFPDSMREMAIRTGHLTPGLLKKELSGMKKMPEQVCITHPKPQYFRTIRSQVKKLKLNNLRILHDGDTIIL